jgi:MSHA biogenesis protein MshG
MPRFDYSARAVDGRALQGQLEASSPDALADQLLGQGLIPIQIKVAADQPESMSHRLHRLLARQPPKAADLLFFTRQMYTLTKAGIPLIQGLTRLSESTADERLKQVIQELVKDLESGRELSAAFARHPKIFNTLYVNMIRVGETSGRLEEAFLRLHGFLERDRVTGERIKTALRYPLMVVSAIGIAIGVLTLLVIPTFAKVFERFQLELPLPTRIILGVSEFAVDYGWYILVGGLLAAYAFRYYRRTDAGRLRWDRFKLRIPVVGHIILRATLARFARAFTMASRAGVPINQVLMAVAMATDNVYLGDRIRDMRNGVERGDALTRTASHTRLFPPLVLQMMSTGEETGQLDDMMQEVAEFYEQQVDYDVQNLSAYLEPVLTIIVGVMVLVLALGIFLPMWDLTQIARH